MHRLTRIDWGGIGEVIYSNPGRGVGVRFHGLSTADRAMLELELGKV
ncbi:MAG: hypothetical protein H0W28_07400 [Pyrinomonadaceae bacterium]|nr:hypothetical protein [Pyrinomonadaceae bacterium]